MRWFKRTNKHLANSDGVQTVERREGEGDWSAAERIARAHLEPDVAEQWIALLRPAVRLTPATDGQPQIARFGGLPLAPDGFSWPEWTGEGPLTFIAEVDLGAIASMDLDAGIPLPGRGRLLAFYFDGSYRDGVDAVVGTWDPETLAGARLLHVEASADECVQQQAPEGVKVLPEKHLAGQQTVTFPTCEHPAVEDVFRERGASHERWMSHQVNDEVFLDALDELLEQEEPGHQLGGWANHLQGPVEDEVAQAALGGDTVKLGSARHVAEAARWTLLLQVASQAEDDIAWGDLGALYWMARRDRLPQVDEVSFTWQCS